MGKLDLFVGVYGAHRSLWENDRATVQVIPTKTASTDPPEGTLKTTGEEGANPQGANPQAQDANHIPCKDEEYKHKPLIDWCDKCSPEEIGVEIFKNSSMDRNVLVARRTCLGSSSSCIPEPSPVGLMKSPGSEMRQKQ